MNSVIYIGIVLIFTVHSLSGQTSGIEIFVIDSYVTPEMPLKIKISFFTSDSVKSQLILDEKYKLQVSTTYTEDHTIEVPLTKFQFDSTEVPFFVIVESKSGKRDTGDVYDLALPADYELRTEGGSSLITICCFGGAIIGMPQPTYVGIDGESYFSLAKEIPVFSIYGSGYNYPVGYIGLEYAYIFNAPYKNFLRLGYKHIFKIDLLEYISPGLNGFTDFLGFNGISPELSIGFFKIYNAFTVYGRYRYNFKPSNTEENFYEISIGLYSNFFSINF